MNKKTIQSTPFGPVILLWKGDWSTPKILRVLLSTPVVSAVSRAAELAPAVGESSCQKIDSTALNIRKLLQGEPVNFSLEIAELRLCGEFQKQVLQAEHAIPRGWVSTYKLIAQRLGSSRGARAVGNALAKNPFPLIVPCHRVIRTDRRLGGYQGGQEMKRALLEMDGVSFGTSGLVNAMRIFYAADKKIPQ